MTRAAASTRVVNYSSSFFTTRVLVNFYFRLQISIPGCSFLQPVDELLEFVQTCGFAISFATCEPGNRIKYEFKKPRMVKALTRPSGPQVR